MPEGSVLCVRDREGGGWALPDSLRAGGFSVVEATSVADGINQLSDTGVDAIVCAAAMTPSDLVTFVEMVQDEGPEVPILLVGDCPDLTPILRAIEAGASAYKPTVDGDEIIDWLEQSLSRRRIDQAVAIHDALRDTVRSIAVDLVDVESRRGVEAVVYEHFASGSLYEYVWVGQYDSDAGVLHHEVPVSGTLDVADVDQLVGGLDPGFIDEAVADQSIKIHEGNIHKRGAAAAGQTGSTGLPAVPVSLAVVPFIFESTVVGVAVVATERDRAFDESERRLLGEVSEVAGAVIWRLNGDNRAEAAADEFVMDVLHELRNPLGIAKAHLELAKEEEDETAFRRVTAALDRIEGIVDMLGAKEFEALDELEARDLEETARAGWASVQTADAELRIDDSGSIIADHDKLERLFANLFRNAVNHGGRDVTVRVGMLEDGFYIMDDGPGIPEERREAVFERGFSTKDGLGIGLDIVRRIVDAHDWDITVSEGDAGGARFEITVPDIEQPNPNDEAIP